MTHAFIATAMESLHLRKCIQSQLLQWGIAVKESGYSYQGGSDMLAGITSGSYQRQYTWETWRDVLKGIEQKWSSEVLLDMEYFYTVFDQIENEFSSGTLNEQHQWNEEILRWWWYNDKGQPWRDALYFPWLGYNWYQDVHYDGQLNRTHCSVGPAHRKQL